MTDIVRRVTVAAAVLGILFLTGIQAEEQVTGSLTVVYNHEGTDTANELQRRGGFSVHVQLEDRSLLFDAGGEATVILENLEQLGLDDGRLEAVVISHNHWDHVYGLPGIMSLARSNPPVFVAQSAAGGLRQQYPHANVVAIKGPKRIGPGIWLTGPLDIEHRGTTLSEQALVIEHPRGLHIIAGCSHPGTVAMVERARDMFPGEAIALVAGGFHLRSTEEKEIREIVDDLQELGVNRIGPSHCTGDRAMRLMRDRWGERFVKLGLGDSYQF
jgi:7,8-dihydropterin-6-yl-methyl-4-(beta-D-ribofuranosyl)aminobenzene 5'-phosphate synthase